MFFLADALPIPDESKEFASLEAAFQELPSSPPGDFGAAFVKMFLTLIALVVLLYLTYWVLKRFIRHRLEKGVGAQAIHILEKRMISPKTMLYLVEFEGKKILFAESHLEIKRLDAHPVELETSSNLP